MAQHSPKVATLCLMQLPRHKNMGKDWHEFSAILLMIRLLLQDKQLLVWNLLKIFPTLQR
jgi:hypothetical protein